MDTDRTAMIETILDQNCTGCGQCVQICPTDVLTMAGSTASIARQADCQTCFQCELYCPADAIFVHPSAEPRPPGAAPDLPTERRFGDYRRQSGWDEWAADPALRNQHWRMEDIFRRARALSTNRT